MCRTMAAPLTSAKQESSENKFVVEKQIGQGKFPVYSVSCPSMGKRFALKVFPKTNPISNRQYTKEKLIMNLKHQNIIQYIPLKCSTDQFYAITTELAPYGELFNFVLNAGFNNEALVRTYFHQLINGLEYMHGQGIAHLDIKLENMMLGNNFVLKFIDFDHAQDIKDKFITSGGTACYRAPEVIKNFCKDLAAADIYSAGVTLYAMMSQEYPFVEVDPSKKQKPLNYDVFVEKNDTFWKEKSESKVGLFSSEFVELINGMLEQNPENRFKISDIKESAWYKGEVLDQESLKIEMKAKWDLLKIKESQSFKPPVSNKQGQKKTWN